MTTWTVTHGDCRVVMAGMEAATVSAIVCDPPYGLSFMGKGWDHGVPGVEFWTEALRVAKPGAHLVAFGGTRTFHRLTCAIEDAGWEIRDCLSWLYGSGFPKSHNGPWGGTALKPAWEPIILARKPLAGTVAATVAAHGTGALNVDGCRIAGPKPDTTRGAGGGKGAYSPIGAQGRIIDDGAGRWPANVVLDDNAAALLDASQKGLQKADDNGPARFFYTAKASRREREAGLEGMPERVAKRYGEQGQGRTPQQTPRIHSPARNHHPTVKPISLMRWLVRLVTSPGGLVLDPFCGSGSTGCAAVLEGQAFHGIEQDAEYVEIARRRVAHWAGTVRAEVQPDLFTRDDSEAA